MRSISIAFVIFIVGLLIVWQNQQTFIHYANTLLYYSPCDTPLEYSVGTIDDRFHISPKQLVTYIQQAEDIWEKPSGKNIFTYSQHAKLTFNLVYDKRQFLSTQINELGQQLQSGKLSLDERIAQYEKLSSDFQSKLNSLNDRITYWNNQGGAPPDEFKKLIQEQQDLKNEAESLNEMARSLNQDTRNYNSQVGTLNQAVESFNQELQYKPEEGLYDGQNQQITIFFTVNHGELVHTLAHEMGHALGISHVYNSHAIMFPYSTMYVSLATDDMQVLTQACKMQSRLVQISKIVLEEIYRLTEKVRTSFK